MHICIYMYIYIYIYLYTHDIYCILIYLYKEYISIKDHFTFKKLVDT